MFYNGARLDEFDKILGLCKNMTNATYMFNSTGLTSLDVSNFDTSKVTNMERMFSANMNLTSLDVSNFNTSNVTTMKNMFSACSGLTSLDVSNFDTSKVTDMYQMFYSCNKLTSLNVSSFNTSNVTNMRQMFYNCDKLPSLDVSNFDTSKVTETAQMFNSCSSLTSLDVSNFDMCSVINATNMFGTPNLINLTSFKNLGKGYTRNLANTSDYTFSLEKCKSLSHESLMDVINNGLYDLNITYDVANGGTLYTQKLELGSKNMGKLTAEEIAIATNKGWSVS